jgi:hypothetical protein
VLRLVAQGLATKEIAHRLGMSPKTAGNHIEHIYTKIDATNRAGASLFAVHHGLLAADDPATRRRRRRAWGELPMKRRSSARRKARA